MLSIAKVILIQSRICIRLYSFSYSLLKRCVYFAGPKSKKKTLKSRPQENEDDSHRQNNNNDNSDSKTAAVEKSSSEGKTIERADVMQSALVQPALAAAENFTGAEDDITKASQEVAEISRLIGKPLTDSHALSLLKNLLLDKIHSKLEESKDSTSASSKSTEEGVNKFVAALAASKKKTEDPEGMRDRLHFALETLLIHTYLNE